MILFIMDMVYFIYDILVVFIIIMLNYVCLYFVINDIKSDDIHDTCTAMCIYNVMNLLFTWIKFNVMSTVQSASFTAS